jgi:hydroxymethylpyrimidine/phosphomethylpyrimidine kinase
LAKTRPYVPSIAGFDPSGGAGVLADIKTFEQHKVVGLAVNTALTFQNENAYLGTQWLSFEHIVAQLNPLFDLYRIDFVKIGLIENLETLNNIVDYLISKNVQIKIVLDPIIKATASDKPFHDEISVALFEKIASKLFMITPNWEEMKQLYPNAEPTEASLALTKYCSVYVKGGHRTDKKGYDVLFDKKSGKSYSFKPKLKLVYPKHGSGCVLSSALVANMAKGFPIIKTCLRAKEYTEGFLESNPTLLGWHRR